jgi:hypothetical protein
MQKNYPGTFYKDEDLVEAEDELGLELERAR